MAETVPETLTKEKLKWIINKNSCEQDNCESVGCGLQPNRSRGIDTSKHVDNLEDKKHVAELFRRFHIQSKQIITPLLI